MVINMLKSDKYYIEKEIDKFNKIGHTGFLNRNDANSIKNILNKKHIKYDIYEPFIECDRIIIYKEIPDITCFKIITNNILKHSDIMGSLYNFNIDEDIIGDIIVKNDEYYFIILSNMKDYFIDNFSIIGRYSIRLEESNIPITEREYIDFELIVSSERIDTVISRIINLNRKYVEEIISNKDVILNYNTLTNKSYVLKENDIFSIRKYGKYKYLGIIRFTKKDNFIVRLKKYN
jgi:RNA-binding protein YlmH